MIGTFDSIFLEADDNRDNSAAASNMVSNVSIAYNAGDSSQRNAVFIAQQKIAKAQKRKDEQNKKKEAKGISTECMDLDKFSSIFYESSKNEVNKDFEKDINSIIKSLKIIDNSITQNNKGDKGFKTEEEISKIRKVVESKGFKPSKYFIKGRYTDNVEVLRYFKPYKDGSGAEIIIQENNMYLTSKFTDLKGYTQVTAFFKKRMKDKSHLI